MRIQGTLLRLQVEVEIIKQKNTTHLSASCFIPAMQTCTHDEIIKITITQTHWPYVGSVWALHYGSAWAPDIVLKGHTWGHDFSLTNRRSGTPGHHEDASWVGIPVCCTSVRIWLLLLYWSNGQFAQQQKRPTEGSICSNDLHLSAESKVN